VAKTSIRLLSAFRQGSQFPVAVRPGIGALRRKDIQVIRQSDRANVGDSLDLDAATRVEHPTENRWDYLLSVVPSSRLVGLEPHSAEDSEVAVVVRKKRNAVDILRDHLRPNVRIDEWIWAATGSVRFSRMERATRSLNQYGIRFAGRAVALR
jgi:hypothetical protein